MRKGYYRVTYDGIGIYEAVRQLVNQEQWVAFLKSEAFKWLPKPPLYPSNYRSYFTQLGYKMFSDKVAPVIRDYLPDKRKIHVQVVSRVDNIVYEDAYQVIVSI